MRPEEGTGAAGPNLPVMGIYWLIKGKLRVNMAITLVNNGE